MSNGPEWPPLSLVGWVLFLSVLFLRFSTQTGCLLNDIHTPQVGIWDLSPALAAIFSLHVTLVLLYWGTGAIPNIPPTP